MDIRLSTRLLPLVQTIQAYHRYETFGLEHIPYSGPAIIACSHSLATYDITLLLAEIYRRTGRIPYSLVDKLFFKVPKLGPLVEKLGCSEGTPENGAKMLTEGHLLCLAPGGMKESLRNRHERYQIRWDNRRGFIRLSLRTGAPIILAACPKADEIFDVYANPLSELFYSKFKVPFFIARGLGLSAIPKPVKLFHLLSAPINPPKIKHKEGEAFEELVTKHHQKVLRAMGKLMKEAISSEPWSGHRRLRPGVD